MPQQPATAGRESVRAWKARSTREKPLLEWEQRRQRGGPRRLEATWVGMIPVMTACNSRRVFAQSDQFQPTPGDDQAWQPSTDPTSRDVFVLACLFVGQEPRASGKVMRKSAI